MAELVVGNKAGSSPAVEAGEEDEAEGTRRKC